jgi:hypothetical protein
VCSLPCGRSVVPHSSRRVAQYAPLFPAPVSALDFRSRSCTGPLFLFLCGPVARTPPCRSNPIPSFLLFPHSTSHWEHTMADAPPHLVTLPSDSPPRHLHFRCVAPPPPFTSYKMPPCLLLLHSTPRSRVELIVSTSSICALVGEAREVVRKKVVGGRATRSSRCSQI